MNARMGLIRRMILEQKDLDDSEIVRMVLDPIRAIFFLAQESTDGQRAAIREEIRQLGFRSVEFNPMDMRESIDMFMEDFSRSGAIYIQAGSHAKAVVAYNPKTRTFYLRDSANSRRQDYSHVDWDEFFNNLTYYGTVYQKPDFSS